MIGKTRLSSDRRKLLCEYEDCEEHHDGDDTCVVPLYEEDLSDLLLDHNNLNDLTDRSENSRTLQQRADPKTATAEIVREDDSE